MRQTRNSSLPCELDLFIARLTGSGRYQSASEVVRDALRLPQEKEHLRGEGGIAEPPRPAVAGVIGKHWRGTR